MSLNRLDATPTPSANPAPPRGELLTEPWTDARAVERARRASLARKASTRRKGVDPTTSERDYSAAELEFLRAMQEYKRKSGRMFPTWSEALEVLRSLGYTKAAGEDAR